MSQQPNLQQKEENILNSIKLSKIIIPVLLGLSVVGYLMYTQLDLQTLRDVNWKMATLWWILLALLMYVARHIFYALRLKYMTNHAFSFWKCMELIVIWEFSSAVSPTTVGGSGVALLLLSQEKLSGAKTVAVVIYSMVLDTIFFVISLPLLYLILGAGIIRPGMASLTDMDGFGVTFITVLLAMIAYGGLFFYGLFINPNATKRFLLLISKIPFLKRFRKGLRQTALDIVLAADELKKQNWAFHLKNFGTTIGAWVTRFLAINFLILALVQGVSYSLTDQSLIYARGETMHVITSFSPTPGGAGVAEYLFGGFYSDYVPAGIATLIALIWRLISYYSYLILGAIIIPVWVRKLVAKRAKSSQ